MSHLVSYRDRLGDDSQSSAAKSPSSSTSAGSYAKTFGVSLAAVWTFCLVLNAVSSSTRVMQSQLERRQKLKEGTVIAVEDLDNARRQAESAAAHYDQSTASRDTAALNLARTEVRASANGYVTNLTLTQGSYASQGKAVLALIDSDSYRVDAYFEETKIPQIKPGAAADVQLMDGAAMIRGKVESIARGITDQDNNDGPELLASVNPTFTWVRLAQRIPVRIRLTDVPASVLIAAGMTCTVVIKESAGTEIAVGIKKES